MGFFSDLSKYSKNHGLLQSKLKEINDNKYLYSEKFNIKPIHDIHLFIMLLFRNGFLGTPQQGPAFGDTIKYLTLDLFNQSCLSAIVYFCYRAGLNELGINSKEELKNSISNFFNTVNTDKLDDIIGEMEQANKEELNQLLFKSFSFILIPAKSQKEITEINSWFYKYINDVYKYVNGTRQNKP